MTSSDAGLMVGTRGGATLLLYDPVMRPLLYGYSTSTKTKVMRALTHTPICSDGDALVLGWCDNLQLSPCSIRQFHRGVRAWTVNGKEGANYPAISSATLKRPEK